MRGSLSQGGIQLQERDFFAQPFSEGELRRLLGGASPREVFAYRSPSVKRLGLDPEALGDDDLVRLMLQEPRLIRRPLLVVDGRLLVAPSEAMLQRVLSG